MPQKTSYFNKNLFFHSLARFWPVWTAYFLVWLLELITLADAMQYRSEENMYRFVVQDIPEGLYITGVVMSIIFAAFAAMALFSHLYNIRSASVFASLPLRRECVFVTQTAAGLAGFWGVNVLVVLLYLPVVGSSGYLSDFLPVAASLLGQLCLLNLFFFAFAVLCAQLTGHILVMPAVYAVLNFTVFVVESLVRELFSAIVYGAVSYGGTSLTFLSPFVEIVEHTGWRAIWGEDPADGTSIFLGSEFIGWGTLAAYAVAGVVILILALWLCRRRRMESAGDVVAVRPLRPVFKYCLAVGCALVLCVILMSMFGFGNLAGTDLLLRVLLLLLLGAFIGYFTAQMLLEKSFRAMRHGWTGYGILAAVIIALTCALDYDVFGLEKALPDPAGVGEVSIRVNGERASFTSPEGIEEVIALQASVVGNKTAHEAVQGSFGPTSSLVILYFGTDDMTLMERRYQFADESADMETATALLNSLEGIESRYSFRLPITENSIRYADVSYYDPETDSYRQAELSAEKALELYEDCIRPDLQDGLLGRAWPLRPDAYYQEVYDATIEIEWEKRRADGNYDSESLRINPETGARRTVSWLRAHGIPIVTEGERYGYVVEKYEPQPGIPQVVTEETAVRSDSSDIIFIN